MKRNKLALLSIVLMLLPSGLGAKGPKVVLNGNTDGYNTIHGEWIRFSQMGPVSLTFREDGTVEGDLGRNGKIEITSAWETEDNKIIFSDREGVTCQAPGIYKIIIDDYTLRINYMDDECGGRVKWVMGLWVRPDFEKKIEELSKRIASDPMWEDYVYRGRIYLAIGKSWEAKQDFNTYLEHDPDYAELYLNRAATGFPTDMEGVVHDCSYVIKLSTREDHLRMAYFLRGLARYELGEKEKACKDFSNAIEHGFIILKEAEKARCIEYWEK